MQYEHDQGGKRQSLLNIVLQIPSYQMKPTNTNTNSSHAVASAQFSHQDNP